MIRNSKLRGALLLMAVLLISGMVVWKFVLPQQEQIPDIWKEQFKNVKADLTLEKVKYSRLTPEGTRWTVRAGRAGLYENSDIMDLEQVKITLVKKNGTNTDIVADEGSYDRANELITLKKHVIVKFESGERLYADVLNYDQKKQIIWSDKPVVVRREQDGLVINAKKMKYYVDTGLIVLKDQESIIPDSEIS